MGQGRPSDRQLARVERMLERCVEAQRAERKERRLIERQKKRAEEEHLESNASNSEPSNQ